MYTSSGISDVIMKDVIGFDERPVTTVQLDTLGIAGSEDGIAQGVEVGDDEVIRNARKRLDRYEAIDRLWHARKI